MLEKYILLTALIQDETMRLLDKGKLRDASDLLLEFRSVCDTDRLRESVILVGGIDISKRYHRLITIVRNEVRFLITKGKLRNASNLLFEFIDAYDNERLDEVVILISGIDDFEREKGTLDYQTIKQERNKFSSSLLNMIKSLSNGDLNSLLRN